MESKFKELDLIDISIMIWNKKITILVVTLIASLLAGMISFIMTPTYSSSVKISLGNISNELYTDPLSATEMILSNDNLQPVMMKLQIDGSIENFKQTIEVIQLSPHLVQINATYTEPGMAKKIVAEVANGFIHKSEKAFNEKRTIVEQLASVLEKQYVQAGQSLDRNKEALTAIETNIQLNNMEKDLARARLLDYVNKDESMLHSLSAQTKEVKTELLEMQKILIIEQPVLPTEPVSPNMVANVAIAIVGTLLVMILGIVIREIFSDIIVNRKE